MTTGFPLINNHSEQGRKVNIKPNDKTIKSRQKAGAKTNITSHEKGI
jgi:hypothetical protein